MGRQPSDGLGSIEKKRQESVNEVITVCQGTSLDRMFELREYQLAKELVLMVKQLQRDHQISFPQSALWNWWNQMDRSSMSALQNVAEAIGRGRGYARTAYLTARGEAFESFATADVVPENIRVPLQSIARELVQAIDSSLLAACNEELKAIESKVMPAKKAASAEQSPIMIPPASEGQAEVD